VLSDAQDTDTLCLPLRAFTKESLSFQSGERLTIVANYQWGIINADVGEATMVVEEECFRDTQYFHVRAYAKTYKFWDNFFLVRDVYEGRFLTHNLRPLYFHRDIKEGGYRMLNTFYFKDDYSVAISLKKNERPQRDTVLRGHSCTYDIISLFFNARNLDFSTLEERKVYPFSFVIDGEMFNLYFHFLGKEERKVEKLGTFKSLKFAVKLIAGEVFDGSNDLFVWISDDKNHIPLFIETPVRVGKVSARLSKYENLKHLLTSKIK
jgi:hypothetical protein